jgi:DNA-binding CsgD family transcriptional regulator
MHLLGPDERDAPSLGERIREAAAQALKGLEGPFLQLSVAELEALQAAAHGLTVAESAGVLDKSPETVKSQRNAVLLKLHARNIAHAVCLATAAGAVDAEQVQPPERRSDPRVLPARELAVVAHAAGVPPRVGRLLDASGGGLTFVSTDPFAEDDLLVATIVRPGERHGVSGLRVRVLAVRERDGVPGQVVHATFLSPPPDGWLDHLAVDAPLPRRVRRRC